MIYYSVIIPTDAVDRKTGEAVILVRVYDRNDWSVIESAVFQSDRELDECVERWTNPK